MPNIVVVGAQWGDEGKGKVVDLLTDKVQVVARFNGGHNAGHTIRIGEEKFVLHLIPSGILHEGILNVMGAGMVIDPWALEKEAAELRARGVAVDEHLVISDRAHVILPHHRAIEMAAEKRRGDRKIGTTQRGIGPCYEDKAGRRGIRMIDLLRPWALPAKLEEARRHYEDICRGAGLEPDLDWDKLYGELGEIGERWRPRIQDASAVLHREMARGYSVLFEGAQATLLDIDLGSYPYVTSSTAGAGGAAAGCGVPVTRIDGVLGVAKAYSTRVGAGPFPSEIGGSLEEEIRTKGGEYGATTGRPRRCGWFDAVVTRYAARTNGFDALVLTKLDVLDGLPEVPICTGYRFEGELLDALPADLTIYEACTPVFEKMKGWSGRTAGVRTFAELPVEAQAYVHRLGELVECEVGIVSTGPERTETIIRDGTPVAAWFA